MTVLNTFFFLFIAALWTVVPSFPVADKTDILIVSAIMVCEDKNYGSVRLVQSFYENNVGQLSRIDFELAEQLGSNKLIAVITRKVFDDTENYSIYVQKPDKTILKFDNESDAVATVGLPCDVAREIIEADKGI